MTTTITFKRITPSPDPSTKSSPLARSSHGISAMGAGGGRLLRLVVYGGENVARTPIVEKFQSLWFAEKRRKRDNRDDDYDEWRWLSPTKAIADDGDEPPPRVAHAQAVVGDVLYVFGGRYGIDMNETAMNDLWMMEIVGNDDDDDDDDDDARFRFVKWTRIDPADADDDGGEVVPEARSFHKMIAVGTDLYMFGGVGKDGRLNDLWKFDTVAKVWTGLGCSEVLRGRGGPCILSLSSSSSSSSGADDDGEGRKGGGDGDGARIAIVAGFAGEETNDGHVHGPIDDGEPPGWEAKGMDGLANLRKRSVSAFGSLPGVNRCIIFGGEVSPSDLGHEGAGGFEDDVAVLDGTTGRLLDVVKKPKKEEGEEEWPRARGWADAPVVGGDTLYVFGGLCGDDKSPERLDDLWECKVSS